MIKMEIIPKAEYKFLYKMTEDEKEWTGGLTKDFLMVTDIECPYKEMMLRAIINKCMNSFISRVTTKDIWGVKLEKFGFKKQGEIYSCDYFKLKLPHECNCK